jgi:hypothetical protein
LNYDNSYIGYACGFNSGGNVTFYLTVTGAPGLHTIDVYPSVWWGPSNFNDQLSVEYRYPLLTPQDGPALIPSFHFTFLITAAASGQNSQSSAAVLPLGPLFGTVSVALSAPWLPMAPPRRSSSGSSGSR